MEKQCFKCLNIKDINLFYVHKQMGDGHLNKCIECCKSEAVKREKELRQNNEWVEKEKQRGREKYKRLNYPLIKPSKEKKSICIKNYIEKYPEKNMAKNASQHIIKPTGYHAHHWSYNKEHYKDVIFLKAEIHYLAHRFIKYDQERMMYRRVDTMELLDTRERHENYILSL